MYKKFTVRVSIDSLVMHNGQTADPLNKYSKAMKELTGKRKKTDADHEALAILEYTAGLYLNAKQQPIIQGRVFESLIAEGARKSKEGKLALSSAFVENDAVFTYDGGPLTLEQLKASDDHRLSVPVRVGQARIVRTRPHFHNVEAVFEVSLQTEIANAEQLKRWIVDGLNLVGIGDWRPRHGRGSVLSFAEVAMPLEAVA